MPSSPFHQPSRAPRAARRQVLAIDQDFGLFNRAWCVAELAEARLLRMPQHVPEAAG